MIEGNRVAVTGAGGFLGRALCRNLVEQRCEIHALVAPPGQLTETPPGLARDLRAELVDEAALSELFAGAQTVFHLAGPPSVRASFDDPVGYVQAHTVGTAAVLAACRRAGVERIVYVSSAEVYGRPQLDPVPESHPLEARSPYAAAKIGAESLVRAFDHAFETASVIVRPFSVYGPEMGAHALLPAILRQLNLDGAVQLADLRPERDYCHVDDVVRGIVAAAAVRIAMTLAVNIGSGSGISVGDLARRTLSLAGNDRELVEDVRKRRPGSADIMRLVADRRCADQILGWEPRVSLDDGLREMLSTCRRGQR